MEAIEAKTEKNGEYAVKIVNLKNDLEDAQESLGEDQKFTSELKKGCATAQTDDDARDLFKKTLPSPSLLQVTDTRDIRDSALQALSGVQNSQKLGFIELALMGKKVSFDKVIKMMDDMVVLLKEEQKDDEKQKEWCETEFRTSELKEVDLNHKIEGLTASIEEMTEGIKTLA